MTATPVVQPCLSFPHISWWTAALQSGTGIALYTGRPRQGVSYRNRYRIATANGPLLLSIPIKGGRRSRAAMADTLIDYKHSWQRQHWGALYSAYGRAPFYEHFGPELEGLIFGGYETLLDFNLAAIRWLCRSMRLQVEISLSDEWAPGMEDRYLALAQPQDLVAKRPYYQIFADRTGFLPDMSAIDILMTEGPYAAAYLAATGEATG